MTKTTEKLIKAVIENGEAITDEAASRVIEILSGKVAAVDYAESDSCMTRAEVAAALRVTPVTVTAWAKRGIIRRIGINGRRKAVGYSRKSVYEILNGGAMPKGGGK